MNFQLFGNTLSLITALIYLGVAANLARAGNWKSLPAAVMGWVSLTGLIGAASLLQFTPTKEFFRPSDPAFAAATSLGWLFIVLTSFLPLIRLVYCLRRPVWVWSTLAGLLTAAYLLLPGDKPIAFVLGAGINLLLSAGALYELWREAGSDAERNRVMHALLIWVCLLAGFLISIWISPVLGQVCFAIAAWISAHDYLEENQSWPFRNGRFLYPSFKPGSLTTRRWLQNSMLAVSAALAAQLLSLSAIPFNWLFPGWGAVLSGLFLAFVLAGIFKLIQIYQPKLLEQVLPSTWNDTHRILREFSVGISNITSPTDLATVAMGLIREAVENRRGILYEIDHEAGPEGGMYRFTALGSIGQIPIEARSASFQAHSPLMAVMRKSRQPIDVQTIFTNTELNCIPENERAWFSRLGMVWLVPIHTRDNWIGLIALDAKLSSEPYQPHDLDLICTLADQLSLAMQNTSLIDSLMRVNNDFRRAYTSMEQSNRQLQQAVFQLERIDQTKSDFISVSSHELRTPLTVMRGYAEMLSDDAEIKKLPAQEKMILGIQGGIMRLNEIVDSMLDLASIDSRTLELNKQPVALYPVIYSVCNSFTTVFQERRIKLVMENLRDLPLIEADAALLSKVFNHLLSNAVKYTPDNGTITISGVMVSPGQAGFPQGGVEIVVADTGIGIDPGNLEIIFNKFSQTGKISLHSTGKTKYKGSGPGLGLAIARGIIDAHGGRIWAVSKGMNEETYPGSQFHIMLPQPLTPDEVS